MKLEARKFCRECNTHRLCSIEFMPGCGGIIGHGVLTLFTLGLWIPIYILIVLMPGTFLKMRCPECGARCK